MRYLFVTWDGGGNLSPELVVAGRLIERGHQVRFLGHRSQRAPIEAAGCGFGAYEAAPDCDQSRPEAALIRDWKGGSPPKLFAEQRDRLLFGPAGAFAADVVAELARYPADAVAVDCLLFGALAAAERSELPSAVLWHTIYSLPTIDVPPFGPGLALPRRWPGRLRDRALRVVGTKLWNTALPSFNATRQALGLRPLDSVVEQFDRLDRVLVLTSRAFDFAAVTGAALPTNVRYVGPQVEVGSPAHAAPDIATDDPLVLVGLSTTYQAQESLLRRVVEALGRLPARVVVTTGPAVELAGPVPTNVERHRWLPHTEVLPNTTLVVTHGGHGTVLASLAHGVPVLCLPMGRDQADVAARAVHAGVGRRLSPKAAEATIAAAARDLLADRAVAANATRLAEVMRAEMAADQATAELEALAKRSSHRPAAGIQPTGQGEHRWQ